MRKSTRDYRAEYARRISGGLAKGQTRSQARGHAKPAESSVRPAGATIDDTRIQVALQTLRKKQNLAAAAKEAKVSTERLRKYAVEHGIIEKEKRRWRIKPDLPRRMLIYSRGESLAITVGDSAAASDVGRYMAAVGRFLETNDPAALAPFLGQSVRDIAGKEHPFETRPNVLYRLSSAGEQTFEQVYRIVI
jgi:hypothetical protein